MASTTTTTAAQVVNDYVQQAGKIISANPTSVACVLIVLALTVAYFELSSDKADGIGNDEILSSSSSSNNSNNTTDHKPLMDVFRFNRDNKNKVAGSFSNNKNKNNNGDDNKAKPFGSSYYYAHNNPSGTTGGYSDGLKTEDYVMNKPRLLSRNGQAVVVEERTDDDDDRVATTNTNTTHKTSSPSPTQQRRSVPVRTYGWEDASDSGRVRIDSLPSSSSSTHNNIPWEDAGIAKDDTEARLSEDGGGLLVRLRSHTTDTDYHLHVRTLYGEASDVKIVWKAKRLLVKLSKKQQGASWPSLAASSSHTTSSSLHAVDEELFRSG